MSKFSPPSRSKNETAILLLLGAALGGFITLAGSTLYREKRLARSLDNLQPVDVLNKVARALQATRDRVVNAVDEQPEPTSANTNA